MPYVIGGKGDTLGCKGGYAVMNSETKEVVGCHPTRSNAEKHMGALYANVTDAKADDNPLSIYPGVGIKRPQQGGGRSRNTTGSNIKSKYGKKPKKSNRGRNSDNTSSSGAIGAGGTSMGAL